MAKIYYNLEARLTFGQQGVISSVGVIHPGLHTHFLSSSF